MLPLKILCLPECHRWLPAWVRAAIRSVRTRVVSRRAKGSPLRWSLSGTSVMSGDRWAITLAEYCYVMYLNEEYDAVIDGG